jgi:hypothetical protein
VAIFNPEVYAWAVLLLLVFGAVTLVYTVVKRKDLYEVMNIIQATHPKAFTSVEEVRSTQEGIFPTRPRRFPDPLARRKGM